MQRTHIVQVAADNTDVFNNNLGELAPTWARRARIQVVASDTDWLFSCRVNDIEYARDCGPHATYGDNAQVIDWGLAHIVCPVKAGSENDVLVDVNVVTAGVGLVAIQYES
jgi:hypothetical protein